MNPKTFPIIILHKTEMPVSELNMYAVRKYYHLVGKKGGFRRLNHIYVDESVGEIFLKCSYLFPPRWKVIETETNNQRGRPGKIIRFRE